MAKHSSARNHRSEIAPEEIYHIYNRGVLKQDIFKDDRDWARFMFSLLFFQSSAYHFDHLSRLALAFLAEGSFPIEPEITAGIIEQRDVRLIAFCLRKNHFHLIVQEVTENGVAKYFQRLGNSHTKYLNTKQRTSGHLFQGPYQCVHISSNEQLLYASAYVHKHEPHLDFPWSSYQDYVKKNRWPQLLDPDIILGQFANGQEYDEWLCRSGAKEKDEEEPFDFDLESAFTD